MSQGKTQSKYKKKKDKVDKRSRRFYAQARFRLQSQNIIINCKETYRITFENYIKLLKINYLNNILFNYF